MQSDYYRFHTIHCWLVHDLNLETISRGALGRTLSLPLREYRHVPSLLNSQSGKTSGGATPHEYIQTSRHV